MTTLHFACPQCGGHHFGTSLDTEKNASGGVTKVTITEHQCHDQHCTGCKWSGQYPPDTMTTETKTTDFDTAILGTTPEANRATRSAAMTALRRIEASHSALVAALEAILSERPNIWLTLPLIEQAEAAIALAKGGGK